jgi:alpha-tubulin suppressor-like RCC1 family protein
VEDGTVYCWGRNDSGQLGIGVAPPGDYRPLPVPVTNPLVSGEVGSGSGEFVEYTDLAAGLEYTCGLAIDKLYCWGGGPVGQGRLQPALMSDQLTFDRLAGGDRHLCAIATSSDLYCVGANEHGQLGTGTTADAPKLVQSTTLLFRQISAGAQHMCGITTSDDLYCWGANDDGQLGTGTIEPSVLTPARVDLKAPLTSMSAGGGHTCAITTSREAYCWGNNEAGQLGTPIAGVRSPTPIPVSGGLLFVSIAAGASHTCASTQELTGYCWGANDFGQIGNADVNAGAQAVPDSIRTYLSFFEISPGLHHTCANSQDHGFCWGANGFGQVGNGSTLPNLVPGLVLGEP